MPKVDSLVFFCPRYLGHKSPEALRVITLGASKMHFSFLNSHGGVSSPAGSHPTSSSKSTISKTPGCTIALLTLSFTITYTRVLPTGQSLFKAFTRCCSGFCSRRGQIPAKARAPLSAETDGHHSSNASARQSARRILLTAI